MPTLPCVEELEDERRSYKEVVSRAVVEVVRQGQEDGRVIYGIPKCVQQMESGPDTVMLCLLIQLTAVLDPVLKIPLLLLKTLCHEKGIDLLHVQGEGKMTQLLNSCSIGPSLKCRNVDVMPPPSDPQALGGNEGGSDLSSGCLMIKYPKLHTSYEDDLVANYVRDNIKNRTDPSVMIPEATEAGMDKNLGFKLKTKKVKMATMQPTASH